MTGAESAASRVELLCVAADGAQSAAVAQADSAIPLLWLSCFVYDDVGAERAEGKDAFSAATSRSLAQARVADTARAVPDGALRGAAQALADALADPVLPERLVLRPAALFVALDGVASRTYLERLIDVVELWEQLRRGLAWARGWKLLRGISPEVARLLEGEDSPVVRYSLIGALAEATPELERLAVSVGQRRHDTMPAALVVGEQGLLVGCFDGSWRLMHSGTANDLCGVWSDGATAYIVGRKGTVLRLHGGECDPMEVPTERDLLAVFGLGVDSVCAVGDAGEVLAYNGRLWRRWPVPTETRLRAVWGSAVDNLFLAGEDGSVFRFDGAGWDRLTLPADASIGALCGTASDLWAAGGVVDGGALFRLSRGGWQQDRTFPRVGWLQSLWLSWADRPVVVDEAGALCARSDSSWDRTPLPLQHVSAGAGGVAPIVVGERDAYGVIVGCGEGKWRVVAAVRGLRLSAVWSGGSPKPPRPCLGQREPPNAESER